VAVTEAMNLAIPEPSTMLLAALAGWMLAGGRLRLRGTGVPEDRDPGISHQLSE
jgi:hypothetical protein